jgi:serine/threonine protein kinase
VNSPVSFGKYLLLSRISVGGMAEVFQAKSFGVDGFEKLLAIKRILPDLAHDPEHVRMFIDEAKITAQLSHANICQLFELGKTDSLHFLAMEFVWGKDLLAILNHFRKLGRPMPAPMAVFIASRIAAGLDYAHRKKDASGRPLGIIHRDVSPPNVLLSYEGEVKLCDFGIAVAATRSSRTQAGVLKGKFGYMSPEQARGLPLDRRSDLFSLGTILYELLTGISLFGGAGDFATLDKVRNVDVPPPSRRVPTLTPELDAIVMKALARDVEDRPAHASELGEDLQRLLFGYQPVFTAQHLAKWMKEAFRADLERERALFETRDADVGDVAEATSIDGPRISLSDDALFDDTPVIWSIDDPLGEDADVFVEERTVLRTRKPRPASLPAQAQTRPAVPAIPNLPLPERVPDRRLDATEDIRVVRHAQASRGTSMRPWLGLAAAVVVVTVGGLLWRAQSRAPTATSAATEPTPGPNGILAVAVLDTGAGEVFLDGRPVGSLKAGEPLTIEGVTVGAHAVRVTRAGMPDCHAQVSLTARRVGVVTCRFDGKAQAARLTLKVRPPTATVVLDNQEISAEAIMEPLVLTPGVPHEVVVQHAGFHSASLVVTPRPGESLERQVTLLAAPVRRALGVAVPRSASPAVGAPGYLLLQTTPWARVLIDNRDTGKKTPVDLATRIVLPPGKHTVTFVVGNRRFSYPIVIEAGREHRLVKILPMNEGT